MTIKSRGLARRRNVSKSSARKPSKQKQALLKRAQFFKAYGGGFEGKAMAGAVRAAKAEMLLEAAKDVGIVEVKWQQDPDVDTSWMDKKDMEDYRSGRVEYLGCVIEVNGKHCASLWGIDLLGGMDDPYVRVIEAEFALKCEDALKAGLRKAQRSARRGLKIKTNVRRGSPRGRRKNSPMVHGSKDLGARMMEWQAPSEPQVGGVGSHFYAGMPVPMASAKQALREIKKDATQHTSRTPAANRKHLSKVISDLSKVIAKAKKTNPKFRVDFDSPQFGRGGMDIDVTPTESGHHVDIDIDQHKHRFGFDVSAHQLPEHAGEPEATGAVMGDVPESAVVPEPATVENRGRRAKRLGRRPNCRGMKMNPARFRLFDDGGKTADRYTLIDSKPQGDTKYRTYFGFSERPWSPQGIGQHGEFSASEWSQQGSFRHLGKRIGLEDLDPDLQKYISKMIKDWGGDPKSAMRGRHSLKAKAKGKKANPRVFDAGSSIRVSYSAADASSFRSQWPGSTVRGSGWFEFSKNGDLVDVGGSASSGDGDDWAAFAADLQKYGTGALAKAKAKKSTRRTTAQKRLPVKRMTSDEKRLVQLEAAFEESGGRGVELAEEIDELRWRVAHKTVRHGKKATRKPKSVANRRRSRKPARRTNRPRKSMAEFIRENRDEIDAGIRRALGRPDARLNNEERRQWILNDESLYNWARSEGVRI